MSRADLDTLCAIATDAGQAILQIYASEFQVDYKGPGDPVTDADRAANDLICERLRVHFPDAAIVAEESAEESYLDYRTSPRVFFVDPLDGTREFVARNGQFVVMIGLLVESAVTLGVVYAPATGTLWFGSPELGAFRRDSDGNEQSIRVGGVEEPAESRVTISRSRRSEPLSEALRRIAPRVVVPMGSAGLKGSLVAEATTDAYLAIGAAGKHWDACALEALVNAAGGRVTDARGLPLNYRAPEMELAHGLLASNQRLHAALLARLTATA